MKKLIYIVCIASLVGCKTSKNRTDQTQANNQLTSIQEFSPELLNNIKVNSDLSFSTGKCFGECPVFDVFYLKDSVLILSSQENLLEMGTYYHLPSDTDKVEFNAIMNMQWSIYDRYYKSLMKDLPPYSFQVKMGNELKKISVNGKGPDELFELKERLIKKVKDLNWIQLEQSE